MHELIIKILRVGLACAVAVPLAASFSLLRADDKTSVVERVLPDNITAKDDARFELLLSNLEAPRALSLLKVNHFSPKSGDILTLSEKFAKLNALIMQETKGSKRWFCLQNVRAMASFQSGEKPDDGFAAYDAVFSVADKAQTNNALYPLRLSIREYLELATYRFHNLGLQDDPRTKVTLLNAWSAYTQISSLPSKELLPPPNFAAAFAAIGIEEQSESLIVQTLADPRIQHSFVLLTGGATVVRKSKPEQATKWLLEARAFLPQKPIRGEDGKVMMALDVNETARFYDQLVDLLETQKQWPEAITYQRERIEKTGGGRGELWVLLGQSGDVEGQKTVITELKSPDLKAREILRASKILIENSASQPKPVEVGVKPEATKKLVPTEAIEILQLLLTPPRVLGIDEQIEARTMLSSALWNSGQLEAATVAVKMEKPESLPPRMQNLWNDLARLQVAIAKSAEKDKAEKPKVN